MKRETRQWALEFGTKWGVPKAVDKLVADGTLEDDSWHNDVAPRFNHQVGHVIVNLTVDHIKKAEREDETHPRFDVWLCACDDDGEFVESAYDGQTLYEGDTQSVALKALTEKIRELRHELRVEAIDRALDETYVTLRRLCRLRLESINATEEEIASAKAETAEMLKEDFEADELPDWEAWVADAIVSLRELKGEDHES